MLTVMARIISLEGIFVIGVVAGKTFRPNGGYGW
jgi:hypothetical protein